jgi:predicted AlkP superfamily phosphohydrolase/phosphomutase
MPDIIINWDPAAKVSTELLAEKYGIVRSPHPPYGVMPYYTGNHRPNAFTIALGPHIGAAKALSGSNILDLAPTILSFFGLTPPAHMKGRVLAALCASGTSGTEPQQDGRAAQASPVGAP